MRKSTIASGLATAALLAGTTLVSFASPAQAASARNGVCEVGEVCFYYNSGQLGSVSDFTASIDNYGTDPATCYVFKSSGAGQGLCIKNNVASVWNRTSASVSVFYNSGYAGASQSIGAGAKANLNSTLKNQNASHRINNSNSKNMSDALYQADGTLVCPFDGYTTTPGRHEGIDFVRGYGSNVYALVSGTVTRVATGYNGSGGLSSIAIYNSSLNKTIVYLHAAPTVTKGQSIAKGQKIATEAYRGASSTHTHVEMRLGYQEYAAKSVNDPVLDNPDPTSFWNSQGYYEA